MPLLRRRAKTEGATSKDYIGFADEHPALAASAYQAAEDAETADSEEGRGAAETPAPAGLQGAEKRSLGRLLRRHSTGTTTTTCSDGGDSSSGSSGISGAHLSGGAAASSSDGSADHGSAASLRAGQMMNGSAASAGAAASRSKGKGVAVAKLGLRIGAVKAKVASFQLLIAESASISSSTTTRYMRSSDTAADELRVASQTGTPTPRGKRPRESLHLNLLAGGGDGAQTASSAVAVQPQD